MNNQQQSGNSRTTSANKQKNTLETKGPSKNKDFKVFNKDGSLGDMPDKEARGSGALDGMVGRGM